MSHALPRSLGPDSDLLAALFLLFSGGGRGEGLELDWPTRGFSFVDRMRMCISLVYLSLLGGWLRLLYG